MQEPETEDVRPDIYRDGNRLLLNRARLCARLREVAVRRQHMNLESIVGLLVAALLLIYLAYALLRPEKF